MRSLVVSDLHANVDALVALERVVARHPVDRILVLGDLVDYGPAPEEVIAWIRARADHVVRGNHDHAMATGEDCRSSPAYKPLSIATRDYFRPRLSDEALAYLASLPPTVRLAGEGLALVHATPRDPLFEYVSGDAIEARWRDALGPVADEPGMLLVGHTHLPFVRRVGALTIVNPGSLGQPKDGDPRGCYAILDDGRVELGRVAYDVDAAVARLMGTGLGTAHKLELARILRSGGGRGRS
jgi:predicted phosphodiesterase